MKILYFFTILCFVSSLSFAQDDKFTSAMQKNLYKMDSINSAASFQELANNFERIASAEKTKWQPYYYSALCLSFCSFLDSVASKKDLYLEKAAKMAATADSMKPNDSEILTLRGFVSLARMAVNPMERYTSYGQEFTSYMEEAKEIDPANPRPEYLQGQTLFYTPEQFGGGKKAALPVLKASKEKYDKFVPADSLSPRWGKEQVEQLITACEQ